VRKCRFLLHHRAPCSRSPIAKCGSRPATQMPHGPGAHERGFITYRTDSVPSPIATRRPAVRWLINYGQDYLSLGPRSVHHQEPQCQEAMRPILRPVDRFPHAQGRPGSNGKDLSQ